VSFTGDVADPKQQLTIAELQAFIASDDTAARM
jgi:hypothetical protein